MAKKFLATAQEALLAGTERAVAMMMNAGQTTAEITAYLATKIGLTGTIFPNVIVDHATEMVEAGRIANGLTGNQSVPLDSIPVNDQLFEQDDETGRTLVIGTVSFDGGLHWYNWQGIFPDSPSADDIEQAISASFADWSQMYPGRFNGFDPSSQVDPQIDIQAIERKF